MLDDKTQTAADSDGSTDASRPPGELGLGFLTVTLETLLNGYLRLDPDTVASLAPLRDKIIHIELRDPTLDLFLMFLDSQVQVRTRSPGAGTPDVIIRATPLALARLAQGNAETSAMQDVYIQGDMHTARALQQLLRAIDIDWEELLAQAIGDTPAHQLARLLRGAAGWGRQTANKMAQDVADYLRFERNDVPTQHDVARFINEVDRLRDDVERLDARLRRLRQRQHPHR